MRTQEERARPWFSCTPLPALAKAGCTSCPPSRPPVTGASPTTGAPGAGPFPPTPNTSYDRRTWGRSVPTNPEHQPGFPGDDLHALLESLSLERVHLVATAAGGITALDYALTHPQRVRSLVAANTIGGVQDEAYLEVQRRLRPSEIQNLPVELRELGPSYRGTDPDGASRWLEIELASRPGGAVPAQPLRDPITYARLQTMQVPALILSGEADLLSPPALMRMLAAHIPTSRFVSLHEAGHAGFWERSQVWNGLVLEFIARH